jgi:hypothetical protein
LPRRPRYDKPGRPRQLVLNETEAAALHHAALVKSTLGRQSHLLAVLHAFERQPEAFRQEVSTFLKDKIAVWRATGERPHWPVAVREACKITDEERRAMRAPFTEVLQ